MIGPFIIETEDFMKAVSPWRRKWGLPWALTMCAINSDGLISESPVSSRHLIPKGENFWLQSAWRSLHRALTGATKRLKKLSHDLARWKRLLKNDCIAKIITVDYFGFRDLLAIQVLEDLDDSQLHNSCFPRSGGRRYHQGFVAVLRAVEGLWLDRVEVRKGE